MLAQEVAARYAQALFDAAQDKDVIDIGYEQMTDLKAFLAKDRSILNFLTAPQVLDDHKRDAVRNVFGDRLHRLFVEFLIVLVDKHRVAFLREILDEFLELVEVAKGIGRAKVITAVKLDQTQREDLVKRLQAKTGLQIKLEERVDPAILGGMIVIMHNEIIDGSVRHGLGLIEDRLMKVKVV